MTKQRAIMFLILILILSISCIPAFHSFLLEPTPTPAVLNLPFVKQIFPPGDLSIGSLIWSPDSTQLLFTFARTSMGEHLLSSLPSEYQLLKLNIRDGTIKVVEKANHPRVALAWLPDDRIAFFASGDLQAGIWLMSPEGEKKFLFNSDQAIWAPNGQQIAFEKFEHNSQTNNLSIIVRDLRDQSEREILKVERNSNSLYLSEWSPDTKNILFIIDDDANSGYDIYVLTLATKEIHRLTRGGYHGGGSWSPDGLLIAYTYKETLRLDEHRTLYLMKSNGNCPIQLIPPSGHDVGGGIWSPDGQWIAFTWNNGIYLLDTSKMAGMERVRNDSICP